MSMDRLLETIRTLDGVLELAPAAGSEFPEIAWGDHFFYYAPDGQVPQREQPYATIVTKNYPDDDLCDLDDRDRWRLNVHVGAAAFTELTGEDPKGDGPRDWTLVDRVMPHPVYRAQGWVAIVNPSADPDGEAVGLVRQAHDDARRRAERRDDA
jgi:hypothetical protein